MRSVYLTIVLSVLGISLGIAQKFEASVSDSKLSVTGTSTLHDWECTVNTFTGYINANIQDNSISAITFFDFSFKVKALESGKSGMDKKTYEALKEGKYPTISYKGSKVTIKEDGSAIFSGNMTMAGTTKSFETPVQITYSNNQIKLVGEQTFKLTEFNIEPPKAMLGTIKTGETVTIHYNILLNNK